MSFYRARVLLCLREYILSGCFFVIYYAQSTREIWQLHKAQSCQLPSHICDRQRFAAFKYHRQPSLNPHGKQYLFNDARSCEINSVFVLGDSQCDCANADIGGSCQESR